ncbi:hypothetical protein [Amycolatopsis mediterranei]|uniref:Uncharacterized protein n=1 Tax=Amycolatopsis mediterranei (strain S699) TaxID=713604 RepID=A0A9R0UBY5_AMYMS|nr:hypothetical protein [Amycolatopsis mediterranei]AEK45223.1 hypothetical protein RAM_33750 [Amycolatopsis mediterranei S699]UZF73306.1 hypothetical protein ISP_006732 [Amycolatopsis mediterranei]
MDATDPRSGSEKTDDEAKPATEQDEGLGEPDPTASDEDERHASEGG